MLKEKNLNKDRKINLLFVVLLCFDIISLAINSIINQFVYYGLKIDSLFLYLMLLILYIQTISIILVRFTKRTLLTIILLTLFICANILLNIEVIDYISNYEIIVLTLALIIIPIGASIQDFDGIYYIWGRIFKWIITLAFIHTILQYQGQYTWIADMTGSYAFLPNALFAIDYSFKYPKISNTIWVLIAISTIIFSGTRGPIVIIFLMVIICTFRYTKKFYQKIIVAFLFGGTITLFVSGLYISVITIISELLLDKGIRVAAFEKIIQYSDYSNGRFEIFKETFNVIIQHPLIGSGIYYDRKYTGVYTHNIILEIIMNYGIPIGIIIVGYLIYKAIKLIKIGSKISSELTSIILILIISVLGKLMFSSSYLKEPLFFLLLGILSINIKKYTIN